MMLWLDVFTQRLQWISTRGRHGWKKGISIVRGSAMIPNESKWYVMTNINDREIQNLNASIFYPNPSLSSLNPRLLRIWGHGKAIPWWRPVDSASMPRQAERYPLHVLTGSSGVCWYSLRIISKKNSLVSTLFRDTLWTSRGKCRAAIWVRHVVPQPLSKISNLGWHGSLLKQH